jgi:hypothetical protein
MRNTSVYLFKAKALAEAKQMEAKGLKAGEDFVGCECFLPSGLCSSGLLSMKRSNLVAMQLNSKATSKPKRSKRASEQLVGSRKSYKEIKKSGCGEFVSGRRHKKLLRLNTVPGSSVFLCIMYNLSYTMTVVHVVCMVSYQR